MRIHLAILASFVLFSMRIRRRSFQRLRKAAARSARSVINWRKCFLNGAVELRRPTGISINVVPELVLVSSVTMLLKLVSEYEMSSQNSQFPGCKSSTLCRVVISSLVSEATVQFRHASTGLLTARHPAKRPYTS